MRQVGDLLRVYQEDKSVTVWVGRTEYVDTTGNTTVSTSDRVLGSYREQLIEYGTIKPESITKNEQYVYGMDLLHGVFWRDNSNGIFPISGGESPQGGREYLMNTFFSDKATALMDDGITNIEINTEWDDKVGLLYVTFKDSDDDTQNETIAFHEKSNRWFSVVNNDPLITKLFDTIGIHTDGDWSVGTITIGDNQNYTYGMSSQIPQSYFEEREGIQCANFLRNQLTSSSSASVSDLFEGEPLRGRTMYIKMTNTSTSEVRMFAIDVTSTKSDI